MTTFETSVPQCLCTIYVLYQDFNIWICCSVAKLYPTLCYPMDYSLPGFPVLNYLLEFAQINVHWDGEASPPSATLFFLCLQSFPASASFPMSQLFSSCVQGVEVSDSTSVLPLNIQGWFPLGLIGLIYLVSKGLSRVLQHHSSKASVLWCSTFFIVQSHIHTWLLEKP